jgi:SAM-dependent methyltransferase
MDWQQAYDSGSTPWDLRGATPALIALLAQPVLGTAGLRAGARVAVPGCGRGHDLRVWSQHGFDAIGFDVAPRAVHEGNALLALNRVRARVLCRDVFGLLPEFAGAFDLVYDYTCYCAIPPHLRQAYADVVTGTLTSGGLFLHLTFPMRAEVAGREGRPPYLITPADLHASFGQRMALVHELPVAGSVAGRAGAECWFLWRKET